MHYQEKYLKVRFALQNLQKTKQSTNNKIKITNAIVNEFQQKNISQYFTSKETMSLFWGKNYQPEIKCILVFKICKF